MRMSDWSSDVCSSDLVLGRTGLEDLDAAVIKVAPAHHALADVLERKQRLVQHRTAAFTAQAQLAGQVLEPDVGRGEAVQHYVAHLSHQFRERLRRVDLHRSEEYTCELQSLMRISYAVFCWNTRKYCFCSCW